MKRINQDNIISIFNYIRGKKHNNRVRNSPFFGLRSISLFLLLLFKRSSSLLAPLFFPILIKADRQNLCKYLDKLIVKLYNRNSNFRNRNLPTLKTGIFYLGKNAFIEGRLLVIISSQQPNPIFADVRTTMIWRSTVLTVKQAAKILK